MVAGSFHLPLGSHRSATIADECWPLFENGNLIPMHQDHIAVFNWL